jgi:hypothetical protein
MSTTDTRIEPAPDRGHDLDLRVGGNPVLPVLERNVSGASPFLLTCDQLWSADSGRAR